MVYITGLFTKMIGKKRNCHLLRTGFVAMTPDEKVPIRINDKDVESDVYLLEARSIGGLSGSPVFVRGTANASVSAGSAIVKEREIQISVPGEFFLLGLIHGHWRIRKGEFNEIDVLETRKGDDTVNLGVSIAVPAQKILEILNRPELVEGRREQDLAMKQQRGGTTQD